jgi:hypothetical protein
MTLHVAPRALCAYAANLSEDLAYVEAIKTYVDSDGNFGTDESGLIGYIFPQRRSYIDALNQMLAHITKVTVASENVMKGIAATCEHTEKRAAQTVVTRAW